MAPAQKECGTSIRGNDDPGAWHSDARRRKNGSPHFFATVRLHSRTHPSFAKNAKEVGHPATLIRLKNRRRKKRAPRAREEDLKFQIVRRGCGDGLSVRRSGSASGWRAGGTRCGIHPGRRAAAAAIALASRGRRTRT